MTRSGLVLSATLAAAAAMLPAGAASALDDAQRQGNVYDHSFAQTQYLHHCSGCHLPDGEGVHHRGIPPFSGVVGKFLQHPRGREFLINVGGMRNGALDTRQRAAVLNYIIEAWGGDDVPADFRPFDEAEIEASFAAWRGDGPKLREQIRAELGALGVDIAPLRSE